MCAIIINVWLEQSFNGVTCKHMKQVKGKISWKSLKVFTVYSPPLCVEAINLLSDYSVIVCSYCSTASLLLALFRLSWLGTEEIIAWMFSLNTGIYFQGIHHLIHELFITKIMAQCTFSRADVPFEHTIHRERKQNDF